MNKQKALWYMNKIMVGGGDAEYSKAHERIFGKNNKLNIMTEEERKKIRALLKANEIEGRKGHGEFNLDIYTTIPVQDHF